jgi:hypothetical protein
VATWPNIWKPDAAIRRARDHQSATNTLFSFWTEI